MEYNLLDNSGNCYNVEETGLETNNKAEYMVTVNDSKSLVSITTNKISERISVI